MNITLEFPARALGASPSLDSDLIRDTAAALRVAVNKGMTQAPDMFALPLVAALEKFAQRMEACHE